MPKYAIKAPDGRTYQIDGPAGATDEQVRAEVMRQHPDAEQVAKKRDAFSPMVDTVKDAFGQVGQDFKEDLNYKPGKSATGDFVDGIVHPFQPRGILRGGKVLADVAGAALSPVAGALNMITEPASRGLAKATGPGYERPHLSTEGGIHLTPLRRQTADETAHEYQGAINTSLSVLAPEAGGAAVKGVTATGKAVNGVAKPVREIMGAERTSKTLASEMGAQSRTVLAARQSEEAQAASGAMAEAQAAAAKAAALRAKAQKARDVGAKRMAQKYKAEADAIAPEPAIGEARSLSEIGDSVRDPAMANKEHIEKSMRESDAQFRAAMDEVAAAKEAENVGVSDMPMAAQIIQRSRDIVAPDPLKRPTVGNPSEAVRGKLHKLVLDTLEPKYIPIDAEHVAGVKAMGHEVVQRGGDNFKVIKPSLRDVDDLRRQLGQAGKGELEGFGAINKVEARSLYQEVSDLMDSYAEGTSKEVLDSYRTHKKALEPHEKFRSGQNVVGMQKGTNEPAVPAAAIPGRMLAGGRDTLEQTAMVAGKEPVTAALRSHVQSALTGKSAKQIESAIAPGTPLHDAMRFDDTLEAAVQAHIANVQGAEQAAASAGKFGKRADAASRYAGKYGESADKYSQVANELQGKSLQNEARVNDIQVKLHHLEQADPKTVSAQYTKIIDDEFVAGRMTAEQHKQGLELAKNAERAFKMKATRDKWLGQASWYAGAGTLGGSMGAAFGPTGMLTGAGIGIGAHVLRSKIMRGK